MNNYLKSYLLMQQVFNYTLQIRYLTIFLVSSVFIYGESLAQKALPLIISANASIPNISAKLPEKYKLLTINHSVMDTVNPYNYSSFRIANIPAPDNTLLTLNVRRFDVISQTGYIIAGGTADNHNISIPKYFSVTGFVEGKPSSYVYLTIFEKYCTGYIELTQSSGEKHRLIITPDDISNANPTMIIYDEADVHTNTPKDIGCAAESLPDYQENFLKILKTMQSYATSPAKENIILEKKMLVTQIAVECDYRFFTINHSSLSFAANYAIALLGSVSAIYQRDVSISIQIPYLRIWNTPSPFTNTDKYTLLAQFSEHWSETMKSVPRAAALLLTDRSVGGGIANVNALCENERGYCLAGVHSLLSFPASGYTWDVDVTSHELGHVFGSAHTHNCDWNPAIDSCYESEGGCYPQIAPKTGTIMSYCHLYSSITLNLHPRVASLIRFNVGKKSCISGMPTTAFHDASVVEIISPVNGGAYPRIEGITPKAVVRNSGAQQLESISVTCITRKFDKTVVSSVSQSISNLTAGASTQIEFVNIPILETGTYHCEITVMTNGDSTLLNNTLSRPFEIITSAPKKSISLLSPNGGESFVAGSTATVTWNQIGMTSVFLDYSSDNGLNWNTAIFNTSAPVGSCSWIVPPINTTQARIRIRDANFSNIGDISDAPFSIVTENDVQALEWISPLPDTSISGEILPVVLVRNNGTHIQYNVPVRVRFIWRASGLELYNQTVLIPSIEPNSLVSVQLPASHLLPNGNYVFIARTLLPNDQNISNDSIGRSSEFKGFSPPLPLTATGTNRSVILNWKSVISSKIESFTLYRGTSQGKLHRVVNVRNTVQSYVDENLTNGTEYFYCVVAQSNLPDSLYIIGTPVTPQGAGTALPSPPILISPKDNSIAIAMPAAPTWSSSDAAPYYHIQIATDAAFTIIVNEHSLSETTYINPYLDFNTTYFWRVRSIGSGGIGEWSSVWRFQTADKCPTFAYNGNGVNSYMDIPDFQWNGKNITIEFWNYVESKNIQSSWAFELGNDASGTNVCRAAVPHGDGIIYWDYGYVDFGGRLRVSYLPYTDKWTHVAFIADDTTIRIYLDGELAASSPLISYPTPIKGLVIGTLQKDVYFTHFGKIDEFRVWNEARSQADIQRDMNHSISPQPELVGYWKFDESSVTNVKDASGHNNNGLLTNSSIIAESNARISCADGTLENNETIDERIYATYSIYPNPASNTATVSFTSERHQFTTIELFSVLGEKAMTIFEGYPVNSHNQFEFNTTELSSGMYLCKALCGENSLIVPLLIFR